MSTADSVTSFTTTGTGSYLLAAPSSSWGYAVNLVAGARDEVQKRYMSVWIIDQDENVPLDKSILHERSMVFTDKTPDEIRAGIALLDLLDAHNKVRAGLKDKEGKILKKIRLRDLQIVIKNW